MGNEHRRLKRVIRDAIKQWKRREIPSPPTPTKMSAGEEAQFKLDLTRRLQDIEASLSKLPADPLRADHKKRLRLDEERLSIEEILKESK
jgi:hypothetical protein